MVSFSNLKDLLEDRPDREIKLWSFTKRHLVLRKWHMLTIWRGKVEQEIPLILSMELKIGSSSLIIVDLTDEDPSALYIFHVFTFYCFFVFFAFFCMFCCLFLYFLLIFVLLFCFFVVFCLFSYFFFCEVFWSVSFLNYIWRKIFENFSCMKESWL